jgi:hypothetical protein
VVLLALLLSALISWVGQVLDVIVGHSLRPLLGDVQNVVLLVRKELGSQRCRGRVGWWRYYRGFRRCPSVLRSGDLKVRLARVSVASTLNVQGAIP